MTDLKTAAAPFKSNVTVLSCSTVPPSFRQQYHAKIPNQMKWNSPHQNFYHPSTQIYVGPQDDPVLATTMNHAITAEPITAAHSLHPRGSKNTGDSHKTVVVNVNVTGKIRPSKLTSTTTIRPGT